MIIGAPLLLKGAMQGLAALAATLFIYWLSLRNGDGEATARALAIICLMAANLALVLVNANSTLNAASLAGLHKSFWIILGGAALVLGAGIALPASRELLHFALPSLTAALLSMLLGCASVLLFSTLLRQWQTAHQKPRPQ
jgi:NAD/NADP transhydrogenase beta subunit